jgi:hypothetical protein
MVAYLMLTRRWMVLATAAIIVPASSLLCTVPFGTEIWTAFLGAISDQAAYLAHGDLPLYRMISFYAALHSLGAATSLAFAGQIIVAGLALLSIVLAVARKAHPRTALGFAALASVMVSPYAYDYDVPIAGIGLALLLPDILKTASAREQGAIYGFIFAAGSYGMLLAAGLRLFYDQRATAGPPLIPSLGGLAMAALLALVLLRLRHGLRLWPSPHQMAKTNS